MLLHKKIKLFIIKTYIGIIKKYNLKNIIRKIYNKIIISPRDKKRLKEITKNNKNLKIHFGCGPTILKGWINIDINYQPNWQKYFLNNYPDYLMGNKNDFFNINFIDAPLPISDNSVDVIFSEDFIEHLDQKETIIFLAETYRILKNGGIHRINTPDLKSSIKRHSDFNKGYAGVYTNEWNKWGHKNVLTKKYLEELAKTIGYREVHFMTKNKSISNLIPPEIRPGNDREIHEQIYCDLIK